MKINKARICEADIPFFPKENSRIVKIVSGGQTGADRGGLDAAVELGIPHGGWCPKGRLAEDGVIPDKYNQSETVSKNYAKRTEKNVVDSSATSIFTNGTPTGGSKKTAEFAEKHGKPYICLDTGKSETETTEQLIDWTRNLRNPQIVLNVAGSRESKAPGIQKQVAKIVGNLITEVNEIVKTGMEETPAKIAIMFFPDLRIACGAFKSDNSRTDYAAETIEIENVHGNLDPKRHFVVTATGSSMDGGNAPIQDGDLLLLEFNEGGTVSNQIFAVEYQDEFGGTAYALKRIEKDVVGRYRLVSANKDYKDIPVSTENMFPFARLKKNLGKMK
ncbi:MAG: putative molybdenum carrier protein [Lentisphaerota bacterium]